MKFETDFNFDQKVFWWDEVKHSISNGTLKQINVCRIGVYAMIDVEGQESYEKIDLNSLYNSSEECRKVICENEIAYLRKRIKKYERQIKEYEEIRDEALNNMKMFFNA